MHPLIHIFVSEVGGQPGGRALLSLAFQRQEGEPQIPSPERAADFHPSATPFGGLGTSRTSMPGVETPGWAKPALRAVPLPSEIELRVKGCISMPGQPAAPNSAPSGRVEAHSVFRNSIKSHFSASVSFVPYTWPVLRLPGSVVSNSKLPAEGAVSKPTFTGSKSRPM
jgi:hypothetical protein